MAKVFYSALINCLRGRLNNAVYSAYRGIEYVRSYCATPYNPNTARQQYVRNSYKALVGIYVSLSDSQKTMWNLYAAQLQTPNTGISAFLHLNQPLICANHADLTHSLLPPLFPSTPKSVWGLTVSSINSVSNLVYWDFPCVSFLYVSIYYRLPKTYTAFPGAYNRFAGTSRADSQCFTHSHTISSATIMKYHAFSLDSHGRKSPVTHEVKLYVP